MNRLSRIRFARYNAAAINGAPAGGRLAAQPLLLKDQVDGGVLQISGTTTIAASGAPVSRRVRLFDLYSGRLLRQTVSDAAGRYAFTHLRPGQYFVLAHDHTGQFNAVVADRVQAA